MPLAAVFVGIGAGRACFLALWVQISTNIGATGIPRCEGSEAATHGLQWTVGGPSPSGRTGKALTRGGSIRLQILSILMPVDPSVSPPTPPEKPGPFQGPTLQRTLMRSKRGLGNPGPKTEWGGA